MFRIANFDPVPDAFRGAFLALGNFDGVHLGHVALLEQLRTLAREAGSKAIALTFDPSPAEVLRPEKAPRALTWIDRRVELLREAGADEVGVFQTGRWLLGLTAREFFDRVILQQLGAKGMIEGPTFGFGRDRGGDAQLLGEWCREAGLAFAIAEPTERDGQIISSTRIRRALTEGQVAEAADLLGRPHRLRGQVVRGAGRGAQLGFPTANLEPIQGLTPADGVYAGRVFFDSERDRPPCPAAVHIGPNITFGAQDRTVEAHLIDFEGMLYGQTLELDLIAHLRSTRKFDGVEELLQQMRADVDRSRSIAG